MRYARLRPEQRRHWPECYHGKLYRVQDGPPDRFTRTNDSEIWIETPTKPFRSVPAEAFEVVELNAPIEEIEVGIDPREIAVELFPNAAGGVIAKASHLPTRRFATWSHHNAEIAKTMATEELARLISRAKRKGR